MADYYRDRLERNFANMKANRAPLEGDWRETALLTRPTRSRHLTPGGKWRSRFNTALADGYGTYASGVCANGLSTGLTSESQKWFKLRTADDDLMEQPGVKDTLGECERRMYAAFARSGFYEAAKAGYGELTDFGTDVGLILENMNTGAACYSLTAGEYWIDQDEAGQVNRLYRRMEMTVAQAFSFFERDKPTWTPQVQAWYDKSDYGKTITICSAIEPNDERVPGGLTHRSMPWRSAWWEEGQTDKSILLRDKGFPEKPFWGARWETVGGDVYGSTWPALNALPDLRELQAQRKQEGDAIDYALFPPLAGPANSRVNLNPRAYTAMSVTDAQLMPRPLWTVNPQAIGMVRESVAESRQNVDRSFYVNLFLAITQMPGTQPRNIPEIDARRQEAITQLGQPVSRVNREKLSPAIERMWAIMLRTGQFPEFPPVMQGADVKIEFISPLAQMQRLAELGAIERVAQFVGFLAGANPTALDKFDADQAIDEFADGAGMPPHIIRSDEDVDKIREGRAQQEAAKQAAESAPALQQAADAARLMSETQVGGKSLLDTVAGQ